MTEREAVRLTDADYYPAQAKAQKPDAVARLAAHMAKVAGDREAKRAGRW